MAQAKVYMTDDQVGQIMQAISATRNEISSVGLQIAEIKGSVSAFGSSLDDERKSREALGRKVDYHDDLLRGDGKTAGLSEQVGNVRELAENASKEVKQIKTAIWAIGSPIAIALIIDVIMRALPMIYGSA